MISSHCSTRTALAQAGRFDDSIKAFRDAKDAKAKDEIKAKALKLPEAYAMRVLAIVEKNPDDPAATWTALRPALR